MCFVRMDYVGLSLYFHYRMTQIAICLSSVNHLGTVIMSLVLWENWWKGWMKMVWW